MKKILELHEKTTKFLAIWGLNIEKFKLKLEEDCHGLATAKIDILYQSNALEASKFTLENLDKDQKELVTVNAKKMIIM